MRRISILAPLLLLSGLSNQTAFGATPVEFALFPGVPSVLTAFIESIPAEALSCSVDADEDQFAAMVADTLFPMAPSPPAGFQAVGLGGSPRLQWAPTEPLDVMVLAYTLTAPGTPATVEFVRACDTEVLLEGLNPGTTYDASLIAVDWSVKFSTPSSISFLVPEVNRSTLMGIAALGGIAWTASRRSRSPS